MRIDGFLVRLGFTKSVLDFDLYCKVFDGQSLILVMYMDDLFLMGAKKLIEWCR